MDGIMVINSVKLLFNHPQSTNDDRFWALVVYFETGPTATLEAYSENNFALASTFIFDEHARERLIVPNQ
jgi:hypothetical protein